MNNISYTYKPSDSLTKDYTEVNKLLDAVQVPSISNECLSNILNLFSKYFIEYTHDYSECVKILEIHFRNLEKLERCSQNTKEFSLEVVKIFTSHFEWLDKNEELIKRNFSIHRVSTTNGYTHNFGLRWDCVAWAIAFKSSIVLTALFNSRESSSEKSKLKLSKPLTEPLVRALLHRPSHLNIDLLKQKTAKCIEILITNGYDLNASMSVEGWGERNPTPIYYACTEMPYGGPTNSAYRKDLIESLITAKADVNLSGLSGGRGADHTTPLFRLLSYDFLTKHDFQNVKTLIEEGADLLARNNLDQTVDEFASRSNFLKNDIKDYLKEAKKGSFIRINAELNSYFIKAICNIILAYVGFSVRASDGEDHPSKVSTVEADRK